MNSDVMTAHEVAEYLKISLWSVYDLSRRDEIPYFKIGRCKRFLRSELIEWATTPKVKRRP